MLVLFVHRKASLKRGRPHTSNIPRVLTPTQSLKSKQPLSRVSTCLSGSPDYEYLAKTSAKGTVSIITKHDELNSIYVAIYSVKRLQMGTEMLLIKRTLCDLDRLGRPRAGDIHECFVTAIYTTGRHLDVSTRLIDAPKRHGPATKRVAASCKIEVCKMEVSDWDRTVQQRPPK
jgi:hypothetical protein